MTCDHLGLILGHLEAIFEAILHRKACELVDVEITLVLLALLWPGGNIGVTFGGLEGDLGPPGALQTLCYVQELTFSSVWWPRTL